MEQIELEIILTLLKNNELHVRGIAKSVKQPHANISRAMKKMLDSNIVDFRTMGKNKIFRLKNGIEALQYAHSAEHFKLLKLIERYPFLSVIVEGILSKTEEELVVIFGSFAKFNAKSDSDIDIFVETEKRTIKTELEKINSRISVKIGVFDKNNILIKEIIKDHVIIKGVEHFYEKNRIFD